MPEFLAQSAVEFQFFMLLFLRVGALIVVAPLFGSRDLPVQLKAGLTLIMTAVLWSVHAGGNFIPPPTSITWFWAIITEVIFGLSLGFVASLIFTGAQVGGIIMGWQIGFGFINIVDPLSGDEVSLMGQFQYMVASLVFIIVGGPLFLFRALSESLWVLPPGSLRWNPLLGNEVTVLFGEIFVIGLKVAAPLIVTLLLMSFIEGLIARTVPQMNILLVGFPIRIGVGLIILLWSTSAIVALYITLFDGMPGLLRNVMGFMR